MRLRRQDESHTCTTRLSGCCARLSCCYKAIQAPSPRYATPVVQTALARVPADASEQSQLPFCTPRMPDMQEEPPILGIGMPLVVHIRRPMATADQVPLRRSPYPGRHRDHLRLRHRPQRSEVSARQASPFIHAPRMPYIPSSARTAAPAGCIWPVRPAWRTCGHWGEGRSDPEAGHGTGSAGRDA